MHSVRTRELEYVETVDVDVVQVTAVVTDEHGRFVSGLTQKDFQVSEDGKPQTITSFSDERTPLELVAAVDVSGSVRDALPGMKKAAARFLGALEPSDQVTLVGFNDNLFTLARRSTDQVMRERAIGRLAAWGGTALYDAIVHAVGVLGRQAGRRAIVLFTDGDDQSSHAPIETAIAQVEGSDAMIYPIGQGRAVHAKDLQKLLQRLATTSGGRAFFSDTPAKLDEVFTEILDDLHAPVLPGLSGARQPARREVASRERGGERREISGSRAAGLSTDETVVNARAIQRQSMKRLAAALSLVAIVDVSAVGQAATPAQPQQPRTFKSSVDLVPVDVNVVDRNGRPVSDLTAQDFALKVDGKSRRIASAQFIAVTRDAERTPIPADYSSNASGTGARLIMLPSIRATSARRRGKYAVDAARRFVGRLSPSDRVGLTTIPGAGPQIDFTANHALIDKALQSVVGQSDQGEHQDNQIGLSEASRCEGRRAGHHAHARSRVPGLAQATSSRPAARSSRTRRERMFADVRSRTRGYAPVACATSWIGSRAARAEDGGPRLGRRSYIDREVGDLNWLGPLAARGQVTLYVLQLEPPAFEAAGAQRLPTRRAISISARTG